ncbi:unnamed protein product [Rangifer tarandus platyrhynchus]|uniref:Uncharacterized protein n=2 Tax=Rangifer tarandus platyrhynchus TaxID=3082113 RepID=A0AC59ZX13_RANTA|nr:unnamed protein product [Rangifer tarandus platyrhynchus]
MSTWSLCACGSLEQKWPQLDPWTRPAQFGNMVREAATLGDFIKRPLSVRQGAYGSPTRQKESFLSSTSHNVSPRIGLGGARMHCDVCTVAYMVRKLGMKPGSLVLSLVLQETDVLPSPSVLNQPTTSSPGPPPSDWRQSRMQSRYCPHSLSSPQTIPSLFPVCGHFCYAYSNTNSIEQITSEEK